MVCFSQILAEFYAVSADDRGIISDLISLYLREHNILAY